MVDNWLCIGRSERCSSDLTLPLTANRTPTATDLLVLVRDFNCRQYQTVKIHLILKLFRYIVIIVIIYSGVRYCVSLLSNASFRLHNAHWENYARLIFRPLTEYIEIRSLQRRCFIRNEISNHVSPSRARNNRIWFQHTSSLSVVHSFWAIGFSVYVVLSNLYEKGFDSI